MSVTLHRIDQFVGRTMNWLYDHLRAVPRHECVVLCDELVNRDEFPGLEARCSGSHELPRRLWRRLAGKKVYPPDTRWINRLAPRVLHSHFGYVALHDTSLVCSLGLPWIVSFYGADVYRRRFQPRYAEVFTRASRVLALGPTMAAKLIEIGCPQEKVRVHPLGVDITSLPTRRRLLGPSQKLRLLYAGAYREKKGILYIIEAVALARERDVPLEIYLVGEGSTEEDRDYQRQVLRRINELGLRDVVVHRPFLRFSELVQLALKLHVFLAPSVTGTDGDSEGTPFVLQQMMATAMACIATVHSDNPYLFGEQGHLLVPERDAEAIADRLVAYARDPELVTQHGALLRREIESRLDVRACAGRLSDLYDEILAES